MKVERIYQTVFLLAALTVTGWLLYSMMEPFIQPLFVAFIFAVACSPLHSRIQKLVRRPTAAALISTLLVILLVLSPLVGLLVVIAQQGMASYTRLAQISAAGGGWAEWIAHTLEAPTNWVSEKTGVAPPKIQQTLSGWVEAISRKLLQSSGSLAGNLGRSIGDATIVFFTLFFLFLQGHAMRRGIIDLIPLERSRAERLMTVTFETINANLFGVVAVALVQGGLAAIAFLICGLDSWLFWGAVAAFASLVPFVGTALIWVPVAIQLAMTGSWGKALFLAIWGIAVIGFSDNIIRPLIVSGRTSMSTLTVFFALLGGLNAFGLIGLVAGPLVFTLVIALYRILDELRQDQLGLAGAGPVSTESPVAPTS